MVNGRRRPRAEIGAPLGRNGGLFKAACRKEIESKGYHIVVNMGDQLSDLEGGHADGEFKLPNPMYFVP